jgi:hypothetical protein
MKIVSIAHQDIGRWGAIMKKYMERLGHEFHDVVLYRTYLDDDQKQMTPIEMLNIPDMYEDADFFVLRWLRDEQIDALGLKDVLTSENYIYKVHGSELRSYMLPYSLGLWKFGQKGTVASFMESNTWSNLPAPSYYHIERPCDFELLPKKAVPADEPFIVHSPTHRMKKGTVFLDESLEALRKEGYEPNVKFIENMPYEEAQRLKLSASLHFDQIGYTGNYGMTSVESWYMGIPSIVEIAPIIRSVHPELEDCVVNATRATLTDVLRDWIDNTDIYKKQGKIGKKFVKRVHDPLRIAKQYIALFEETMSAYAPSIISETRFGGIS